MMMTGDELDSIELIPPAVERVTARALVLVAITCRSSLEADAREPGAEALRQQIVAWLRAVGIDRELEDRERMMLEAPLGSLDQRTVINASWEGEGAAVLAWALGKYELPRYDQIVVSPDVGDALGFLGDRSSSVLAAPRLRRADQIDDLREKMFALHWRLREFSLRRARLDFAKLARECSFGPLDIRGLELINGDLAIDGRSLLDVAEDRWHECLSIAAERHRASNWLAGFETVYSEVTADT